MAYSQRVSRLNTKLGEDRGKGELELLRRIRERASQGTRTGLSLGIGDDCALLGLRAGEQAAVTTDLSIEGRHFRLDWHSPESVGHRTLARGLSDLAAMGARPVAAFLSLGLPAGLTRARGRAKPWVERFYDGLLGLAEEYGVPLAGGDLAEAPLTVADIVLLGAVPHDLALRRAGARAGDRLFVTGELGGAALGLAKLQALGRTPKGHAPELEKHLFPAPRVRQGLKLRGLATAAIDISDGIATDLDHLCKESRLGAEVWAETLPLATGATIEQALYGGEDYELLFTAAEGTKIPRRIGGVAVTEIGRMRRSRRGRPRVALRTENGVEELVRRGWEHFA